MDERGQHWIYNIPYIFQEGNNIKTSKRVYIVDKNLPLYDDYLIPLNKECGWISNYLLAKQVVLKELRTMTGLKIEGYPIDAKYLTLLAPEKIEFEKIIRDPMPFYVVAKFFSEMKKTRKQVNRIKYAKKIVSLVNHLYPLLRLILSQLDKRNYYLKEYGVAKLYIEALNISKDSQLAKSLLDIKHKGFEFAKDLSIIIKAYSTVEESIISIYEVDRRLTYLGREKEKLPIIRYLLSHITAEDHIWLILIILKYNMFQKSILQAIHPNAEELFNMTIDLKLLADMNVTTFEKYPIKPFQSLAPMLAKRVPIEKLFKTVQCYYSEIKFDGERVQIHKDKKKITLFSRAGINVTSIYSAIVLVLSKNIKAYNCRIDCNM